MLKAALLCAHRFTVPTVVNLFKYVRLIPVSEVVRDVSHTRMNLGWASAPKASYWQQKKVIQTRGKFYSNPNVWIGQKKVTKLLICHEHGPTPKRD